jgi:hypothetical protein
MSRTYGSSKIVLYGLLVFACKNVHELLVKVAQTCTSDENQTRFVQEHLDVGMES